MSPTTKVKREELEAAAKDPEAAALLTQKYRKTVADPVRSSVLLGKDLQKFQEVLKTLKRKAEAKNWFPAKREPGKRKLEPDDFSGTIGRFAKSGAE